MLPHVPPKTVEVSRLSHAFILQLSMGLVTVALQSATVQNMGKINGFLGHKTRSQAKRVYYYYFFANLTPWKEHVPTAQSAIVLHGKN